MDYNDYIDWDEGPEDASISVAINICENCGKRCDELHHVPEFDYMGCEDCLDEAMRLLEREAGGKELWPAERQILAVIRRKPMGQALSATETKEVA
jgi:hypothetical protein